MKRHAAFGVEAADAVVVFGDLLGRFVAASLLGDEMQQDGLPESDGYSQKVGDALGIVSVHRAEISEAHVLEKRRADETPVQAGLDPVRKPVQLFTARHFGRQIAVPELQAEIARPQAYLGQIPGDRADVRRDGHAVVVQNDDHRLAAGPGVV
jgi:hypothetical protein